MGEKVIDASPVLQQITMYKNTWYIWPLLGLLLSVATWLLLSYRVEAHARGFGQKLAFLWSPWLPKSMVVIDRKIFYDDEVTITKGESSYIIHASDGAEYTADYTPDEIARITSAWGARGPEEVDSPFSLSWRWLISSMLLVYFVSMGLLFAWADPRVNAIEIMIFFGYTIPSDIVTFVAQERALNIVLSAVIFSIVFAWWFSMLNRLSTRQTKKAVYVSISVGDTVKLIPAIEPDSPANVFRVLNREIILSIPDDVMEQLKSIAKKMHLDTHALVEVFSKARLADYWQKQTATLLTKIDDYKLAGEAEATLKMQALAPRLMRSFTKIIVLTSLAALLIGFFIGWGFGSTWGVSVQPTGSSSQGPEQGPEGVPLEPGNNTTVTPAPPPPPPIGG